VGANPTRCRHCKRGAPIPSRNAGRHCVPPELASRRGDGRGKTSIGASIRKPGDWRRAVLSSGEHVARQTSAREHAAKEPLAKAVCLLDISPFSFPRNLLHSLKRRGRSRHGNGGRFVR
jgi:hypothetical protein